MSRFSDTTGQYTGRFSPKEQIGVDRKREPQGYTKRVGIAKRLKSILRYLFRQRY